MDIVGFIKVRELKIVLEEIEGRGSLCVGDVEVGSPKYVFLFPLRLKDTMRVCRFT